VAIVCPFSLTFLQGGLSPSQAHTDSISRHRYYYAESHALHKMRDTATDEVAWSVSMSVCLVCLLGTRVSRIKTAEPIEMPFGGVDS